MKNRTTAIGYGLLLALFFGFLYFNKDAAEELERQQAIQDSLANVEQVESQIAHEVEMPVLEEAPVKDVEEYTIENDLIVFNVKNYGGSPSFVSLKEFKKYDSTDLILLNNESGKFQYTIPLVSGEVLNTADLLFNPIIQKKDKIVLEAKIDSLRSIVQHYSMTEGSYLLDYKVEFKGFDGIISPKNKYVLLDWGASIAQQERNIKDEKATSTIYYKYISDSDKERLDERGDDEGNLKGNIHWLSFKQKFFNMTLISQEGFGEDGSEISTVEENVPEGIVEEMKAEIYLPFSGQSIDTHVWKWYFGPNHYQTLKKLDVGIEKIIPLGWGIFGWVNKGLVIPIFNFLEQYISNYGLIILCLTLAIKLMLALPMFKSYQSMAKMRVLKPELDELKVKTGGDMQKMQQEQMKLYKQAGVSPLGGCLPQLVQLPILFAMFRFFPASIELRQESLWWAEDLSSYDSILDLGFSIPGYGDHVSLFTLLMTVTTLVYTYMNSQTSAGLQGPMKFMMYLMPIMFLGLFNNYSSALSFYYFLSTCITIIQNVIVRRFFIDEDKLHKQIQENKKKKVNVKKSRFQKRLEEMAKQSQQRPPAKNKK